MCCGDEGDAWKFGKKRTETHEEEENADILFTLFRIKVHRLIQPCC